MKILAIDDNLDNLITIRALIQEAFPNVEVYTALNGAEGLNLAATKDPDVILLDIIMPGMDGYDVCRKLKEDRFLSNIPVVFVTAIKDDKESRIKALEAGAEAFIAKPIDQSELVAQIRAMARIKVANVERFDENVRLAALVAERTSELKKNHTATLNLLEDLNQENEARKKTEEALLKSEARLTRAELASKSGNWELHLDKNLIISSVGAAILYGFSKLENNFEDIREVPLQGYRAKIAEALKNLIEKDEPYNLEFKIKQQGTGNIIDIHSIAFFDREKNIVFGVINDVTEEKKAKEALRASEELYRSVIHASPDNITVTDLSGSILMISPKGCELVGVAEDQMLGKNINEFLVPEERGRASRNITLMFQGIFNGPEEYKLLKPDGGVIDTEINAEFVRDVNGDPTGLVFAIRDITERKLAEEKLNYVSRLYALLSQVNHAIVRIKNAEELLRSICELAIRYGEFQMCWIGIYDEAIDLIRPHVCAGHNDGYLDILHINPHKNKTAQGPTGRAFLEGRLMYSNDIENDPFMRPWKLEALKRGYRSSFSAPLYRKQKKFGTITIYGSKINFFNKEEQNLLSEISENISFALDVIDSELERNMAEEALVKSEAKYREFVENSPEAIAIYSDNVVTYVNKECMRLMRAESKNQLVGMSVVDFIHPDNRKSFLSRMLKLAASEIDISLPLVEEKYIRLDGTPIFVEVKVMPLMLEDKPAFQLTARDINDRKLVESALEQSRVELKAIYDNAPVMMCLVDKDRQVLFANQAFNDFTDTNVDDISKEKTVERLIGGLMGCINTLETNVGCGLGEHCEHCNLKKTIQNTFSTGKGQNNIEYQSTAIIGHDRREVFLLASTALIQTDDEPNLLLCLSDITDRKVAEDALFKSEMILRTFIDNIPFDIWARDVNSVGILENKKMVERTGSIIGKKTSELNASPDAIELWESINARAFAGEIIDDEYEFEVNKEQNYFRQIVFPIYDKTKVSGIASINIDITERKRFEKALDESQEQLKKFAAHLQYVREEERLLLAREIHDELGQILIAIKIDLGLLRQYILKNTVDEAYAKTLEKFNDLFALVDNTIKTARRIMTDLRPEVLDLLGFVDTVKQHVAKFEERYNIFCHVYATDKPIGIDSQQSVALFRIVQEALNNIYKHAMAKEVAINIRLENAALVLEIIDDGIGFDVNEKTRPDSYGLIGMKERAFLLGAALLIDSRIGEGTTIRIKVPQIPGQIVEPGKLI